ncbi:hypothetical protein QF042_005376 [Pedobacter sp. W3I1]|uniref:MAC/perforin domain-containing protein n=1 Tax=Pedobacter sp. W3I1 TaxID=3042291 RepID=UPI00278A6D62|nr:MAC/perforin domain-containing protein [Pedobacter sp. W3I1]MDQ0641811.1 hypothetical protein [Pedobacter sp. W3I1]
MKNNYKLKILCLLCVVTTLFSNCKKSDLKEEKGLINNHNALAIHGDGKWDLLGYGYDMTGELFASSNASDAAIIDVDRFNTDYPNRINTPTDTYGYYAVYSGATALDYIRDVNKKETYGLTVNAGEKEVNTYGSANFSKTNENQSTYTYNSKYSYASFESRVRIKSITFTGDATLDILRNYLTPLFIANLSNYSADELVERYGTHVLLGVSIGGRLKYDYKGAIVKETTFERKVRAIKAGFSIGVDKIFGVNISSDVSNEEKVTITNETTDKAFIGTYYGGTNSGTSFSTDAAGNTSQNVNLAGWQSSITVNNATLIDITKSVPLYELITDPVKKQQVKEAVEKYITDRQISLVFEAFPLYRFYNWTEHYYTTTNGNYPGYHFEGIEGYLYKEEVNGTVPLYSFYNGTDHYYTTTNGGYLGYQFEGVVGYIYINQFPGTVPLYRYYNYTDHYYATASGNYPGYHYEGIAGYLYKTKP